MENKKTTSEAQTQSPVIEEAAARLGIKLESLRPYSPNLIQIERL
jgi:transposase